MSGPYDDYENDYEDRYRREGFDENNRRQDFGPYDYDPYDQRAYPRHDYEPHRGTTILVLGVLGIMVCAPLSIAAWIMGHQDLQKMQDGTMDPSGESTTRVGQVLGIVGTILLFLSICFVGFIIVFVAG